MSKAYLYNVASRELSRSLTNIADGSVAAAEDEEGAGRVIAADANHVLDLGHHTTTTVRVRLTRTHKQTSLHDCVQ